MEPPRRDQAISPTVVALVVCLIVAILVAVIAAFVFGGSEGAAMPEATLEASEAPTAGDYGYLNLTISAGPTIDLTELEAVGSAGLSDDAVQIQNEEELLRAGDTIAIRFTAAAQPGETIVVEWSPPDSSQRRVFFEYTLSEEWDR